MRLPSVRNISEALVARNITATDKFTHGTFDVVCGWPLSGQYGPGSRWIYYALILGCLFSGPRPWLRNPCLGAALILPFVAAVHAILLAAAHVDGAADMDIYGAFQFCSIAVLAAPHVVRLSIASFSGPGKYIALSETALLLAGLLSLTVEFYKVTPTRCDRNVLGSSTVSRVTSLPHGKYPLLGSCGFRCSAESGPFSILRRGSNRDIFVLPYPNRLSAGTATLFSAACCIPCILSLVSYSDRLRQARHPHQDEAPLPANIIDRPSDYIRRFIVMIDAPLTAGAMLAIVILGEMNLFSPQLRYETEPAASVGQWAPVISTCMVVLGSVYLLLSGENSSTRAMKLKGGLNARDQMRRRPQLQNLKLPLIRPAPAHLRSNGVVNDE